MVAPLKSICLVVFLTPNTFFYFADHLSLTVYQIEKTKHVTWICQQQLHPVSRTSQVGEYAESMKRGKFIVGVKLYSFPIYL